jgi:hypothetical protein
MRFFSINSFLLPSAALVTAVGQKKFIRVDRMVADG